MKALKKLNLQFITAIYFVFYFIGFIIPFFTGDMSLSSPQDLTVLLAFIFFSSGFVVSWFNEKAAGNLLQLWVVLIWALGLFYWPDAGMVMILSAPVLVIGVFMNRKSYLRSSESLNRQMDWKYTLQLFLYNYLILCLLVVFSEFTHYEYNDFLSMPFILFPVLFVLFIAGVVLSFKNEIIAGILMLIWYIIVIIGSVFSSDFLNTGPWFVFGIPVLIHGILYLVYHYKIKLSDQHRL